MKENKILTYWDFSLKIVAEPWSLDGGASSKKILAVPRRRLRWLWSLGKLNRADWPLY